MLSPDEISDIQSLTTHLAEMTKEKYRIECAFKEAERQLAIYLQNLKVKK